MFQRSGPNADPCGHPLFTTFQELASDPSLILFCRLERSERRRFTKRFSIKAEQRKILQ